MTIKLNIRRIRKERGLSLEQLAGVIGVSGGYLSELERGVKAINSNRISQISTALNCEPADLFSDGRYDDPNSISENFSLLTTRNKRLVGVVIAALLEEQGQST